MFNDYIEKGLYISGLALNLINVIVFSLLIASSERTFKSSMFKYLLAKSVFDTYYMLRGLFLRFFWDCPGCNAKESLVEALFFWIGVFYLGHAASLMSMFCEIAATLSRFKAISQKLAILNRVSNKIVFLVMLVNTLIVYTYKIFERTLIVERKNQTVLYRLRLNSFAASENLLLVEFMHSVFRDGVCVLIILVINVATIISMHQSYKRKRRLTLNQPANTRKRTRAETLNTSDENQSTQSAPARRTLLELRKFRRSENRLTVMVLMTGVIACIGHGVYFAYSLPHHQKSFCFYTITAFLFYSSYVINIFIYIYFNKGFRKCLFNKVLPIGWCLRRCCGHRPNTAMSSDTAPSSPARHLRIDKSPNRQGAELQLKSDEAP